MKIPPKYYLFSGGLEHIDEAKEYIARYGLTSDDVKLVRRENEIAVITKREINLCENPKS